jgi:hypothetical protein
MKHDMSRRFAYIETCLYWGTGLTASHLGEVFGIARQNAQKTINNYRRHHPDNIFYHASQKCHLASDEFEPVYIEKSTERYLDYIGGIYSVERYWAETEWSEIPFESDDKYLKPPQHRDIVQTVLSSIKNKHSLHILYRAKFEPLTLLVSAHHLVYANYRYHVRAYDHEKDRFIDLVLTRFIEASKAEENWFSLLNDERWIKKLNLQFQINPKLPKKAQRALQADYGLGTSTIRHIEVRHAMLGYICREMERIDWRYGVRLWLDINGCCSKPC